MNGDEKEAMRITAVTRMRQGLVATKMADRIAGGVNTAFSSAQMTLDMFRSTVALVFAARYTELLGQTVGEQDDPFLDMVAGRDSMYLYTRDGCILLDWVEFGGHDPLASVTLLQKGTGGGIMWLADMMKDEEFQQRLCGLEAEDMKGQLERAMGELEMELMGGGQNEVGFGSKTVH